MLVHEFHREETNTKSELASLSFFKQFQTLFPAIYEEILAKFNAGPLS